MIPCKRSSEPSGKKSLKQNCLCRLSPEKLIKMVAWRSKSCRLASMLALTVSFFLVELISGYMTNSMSLVADSFHMLSDVVALAIAFFSVRIAKKKTKQNTFGWARAEVLGALINSVFLFAVCFSIFIEAVKRLIEIEVVHDPLQILVVGTLGLVINILGLALFHGHAHEHHSHPIRASEEQHGIIDEPLADEAGFASPGRKMLENSSVIDVSNLQDAKKFCINRPMADETENADVQYRHRAGVKHVAQSSEMLPELLLPNKSDTKAAGHDHHHHKSNSGGHHSHANLNMRAAFLHVLSDALGSVVVIISALVIWLAEEWTYRYYIDPLMSIALVTLIFCTTGPVIKESALVLLQTVPTHIKIEDLKAKLVHLFPEISSVHEFHVWQLAGNKIIASAHIRCRSIVDYMLLAKRIKMFFHNEGIHSTTIQPEFAEQQTAKGVVSILPPNNSKNLNDADVCCTLPLSHDINLNTVNEHASALPRDKRGDLDESCDPVESEEFLMNLPSGNYVSGFREAIGGSNVDDDKEENAGLQHHERAGCVLQCPADAAEYECQKARCCSDAAVERLQVIVSTLTPVSSSSTPGTSGGAKRGGIFNMFSPASGDAGSAVATTGAASRAFTGSGRGNESSSKKNYYWL